MFTLFRETIRIAVDSIKSQMLRTVLTTIIIAIGITALVGILSAVSALENTMSSDFSSMAANTFNIQRYESTNQRQGGERQKINPSISYTDARAVKDSYQLSVTRTASGLTGTTRAKVNYENKNTCPEVTVLGATAYYIRSSRLKVEEGREFTFFDVENNNNVCLI